MGQHFSHAGHTPTLGDFEPDTSERRKLRLRASKSLPFHNSDENEALSRATASTGQSSFKASMSPPSPSSSGTISEGNDNVILIPDRDANGLHQPPTLRYTNSTRNLHDQTPEASATTATTTIPATQTNRPSAFVLPVRQPQQHAQPHQAVPNKKLATLPDKRSNPVKFPRKRFFDHRNDHSPHHHSQEPPQDSSYLERMYDSRTWEMYRRITNHREKLEAFNAANAAEKVKSERNSSTNLTYMSDPVQRVTNSQTMEGGVDYDNFYDPAIDDDADSRRGGAFVFEDHSAPPYHHHHHWDNGQHHHTHGNCHNAECYSEWEHMYGDDGESNKDSTNAHGGHHETIFLFDF